MSQCPPPVRVCHSRLSAGILQGDRGVHLPSQVWVGNIDFDDCSRLLLRRIMEHHFGRVKAVARNRASSIKTAHSRDFPANASHYINYISNNYISNHILYYDSYSILSYYSYYKSVTEATRFSTLLTWAYQYSATSF